MHIIAPIAERNEQRKLGEITNGANGKAILGYWEAVTPVKDAEAHTSLWEGVNDIVLIASQYIMRSMTGRQV
ncbi:hypothetical protein [Paenibacillus alvei]|uniref:hypothetical protein n=1 Tax=Paenibacillus alvei TaxID=44250 RepID=UPI0002F1A31A|nr:hypothetical protein [Paenibacillus alvei]